MLTLRVETLQFPARLNPADSRTAAIVRALIRHARQVLCAVFGGHEMVKHFEPERLSLECIHCGLQSSGWTIGVESRYRRPAAVVSISSRRRQVPATALDPAAAHTAHEAA